MPSSQRWSPARTMGARQRKESVMEATKRTRLEWLCRVYNGDKEAVSETEADAQLFDTTHMVGLDTFADMFPPLVKLRERVGDYTLTLGGIEHTAPDVTYADLLHEGEVIFVLYVRFEAQAPNRIMYWSSYPPLPDGVTVRAYTAADAPGCVALEEACPWNWLMVRAGSSIVAMRLTTTCA